MVQDRPHTRGYWLQDRPYLEQADDNRHQEPQDTTIRSLPMTIDKALRENCHIPNKHYFLATIDENGQVRTFTSLKVPEPRVQEFFSGEGFQSCAQSVSSDLVTTPHWEESAFGLGNDISQHPLVLKQRLNQGRYSHGPEAFDDISSHRARKRSRVAVGNYQRQFDVVEEEENPPPPPTSAKRTIEIGNQKAIWEFYEQRFKDCQQTACKLIAKAWIKAVEPKKQSTHPYTGKDEKAPDWWPQPWGDAKDERVRHKEPDHLYKRERVHLLNHILRMVVEPNHKQHRDIQKLYLDVSKLEEVTFEALSSFFTDKDNPSNAKKKPYLKEIFKVAKQEERHKGGCIDGTTRVLVQSNDKVLEDYMSDNEDCSQVKDDDDQEDHTSISTSVSAPKSATTHAMSLHPHDTDQNHAGHMPNIQYAEEIQVRPQYSQQMLGSDLPPGQSHYVGDNVMAQPPLHPADNMSLHAMYSSHDASRRNSIFAPSSDYTSPTTPSMYQGWQSGTTAPSSASMYAVPSQQAGAHSPFVGQAPIGMPQGQQYMGNSFDGMPRGGHDMNQGNMYRPSAVGHSLVHPQSGYEYVQQDSRGLTVPDIKMEPLAMPRNSLN